MFVQAALERWCQPAMPVKIVVKKMPGGLLGQCLAKPEDEVFVITLNKDMGAPQAVDTLVHEWAHALAWNYVHADLAKNAFSQKHFDWFAHDEAWGCAYSKTYRAYLDAVELVAIADKFPDKETRDAAMQAHINHSTKKRGTLL
ncbi:hypothetical protein EBZ39_00425 [bacterium]|nr:hypothetical protein [bacterium]